jgi:RNA polymerase sigma-70 factor (ECF subfamily)
MADDLPTKDYGELIARTDPAARNELLRRVGDALYRMASRFLGAYPAVVPYEQTGDVLNAAVIRLLRALEDVTPETPRQFFALAMLQIRRELIDLSRKYRGPQGPGPNIAPQPTGFDPAAPADSTDLDRWREFHERVADLPPEEREVMDLLYYQELPQAEAAAVLGISERTLQRRWQDARVRLARLLRDPPTS